MSNQIVEASSATPAAPPDDTAALYIERAPFPPIDAPPAAEPSSEIEGMRHLLFVDHDVRVQHSIAGSLHDVDPKWVMSFASSVDEALGRLKDGNIDVIVTDITMPGRDGFDLLKTVAASAEFKHIPVIVLTNLTDSAFKRRALEAGAFDLIAKPVDREDLIARLRSVLRMKDYQDSINTLNATLEKQVAERTRELETSQTDLLICLAMAGECSDSDTGRHLLRVAGYTRLLAKTIGLPGKQVDHLFRASLLHDIGKLSVADEILQKPGALTPAERAEMQEHCDNGYQILTTPSAVAGHFNEERPAANSFLRAAAEIALTHHERWDGKGYPQGLAEETIPLPGRIVAIADVYDALTTLRPYKQPISHDEAIRVLVEGRGTQFDPTLIDALQKVAGEFDQICKKWSDVPGEESDNPIRAVGTLIAANV